VHGARRLTLLPVGIAAAVLVQAVLLQPIIERTIGQPTPTRQLSKCPLH
jgi:hypothetical protein